jgi:hypothetical protein
MHHPINCAVIGSFGWHDNLMFLATLQCHTHLPKSEGSVHSLACALHALTTFSFYYNSLFVKRLIPPSFKLIITKKKHEKNMKNTSWSYFYFFYFKDNKVILLC